MNSFLYHYRAIFRSNYDGDTVTVDIDLGMGIWLRGERLRLFGINTPEIRNNDPVDKAKAIEAKDFIASRIPEDSAILIKTHKDKTGKFGRLLATIFLPGGENLNDLLVEEGLAVRAEY